MKLALPFLMLLLLAFPPTARCAFYRWVDAEGVTHLTDDPDTIPARYQKRAKKLGLPEERPSSGAAGTPQSPPQPAPQAPQPAGAQEPPFGGHPEPWWRENFSALRGELDTVQKDLADRQTKIAALRRKRAIYMRAQDREAVNAMQDAISADEVRIAQLQNQISALELEAAKAAVPVQWRQ